jgi:hypothetical protein
VQRALVVLIVVATAGCQRGDQPGPAEEPRQSPKPTASPPLPAPEPSAPELRAVGSGEGPKRSEGSNAGRISVEEAVRLAEQYIHDQGYTDFIPPDTAKLVPESIARVGRERWIGMRHNRLRPRACGYLERSRRDPDGWTVGFEFVDARNPYVGRAVTMDASGRNLRVEHVDLLLKKIKPWPE